MMGELGKIYSLEESQYSGTQHNIILNLSPQEKDRYVYSHTLFGGMRKDEKMGPFPRGMHMDKKVCGIYKPSRDYTWALMLKIYFRFHFRILTSILCLLKHKFPFFFFFPSSIPVSHCLLHEDFVVELQGLSLSQGKKEYR